MTTTLTTSPTGTTDTADVQTTGPNARAARPIAWRTVAFAAAIIYGLGVPAALALHHAAATDPAPQVTTTCVHGDLIDVSTGPAGRVTLTAPMDAPACTSKEIQ